MRKAVLIATGFVLFQMGVAVATPIDDVALNEVYRSCVAAAPPGVPLERQQRYCGCFRVETQRIFTRESMAAVEERMRMNATTMEDRDLVESMTRTCNAAVQQQAPAPSSPVTSRPTAPQAPTGRPPAQAPVSGALTAAELDAEERECLSSIESAPTFSASLPLRQRFCGCTRNWMQRTLTRETLGGLNARQSSNTLTMQDRDTMEQLAGACMAEAQRSVAAPQPAPQPSAPAAPSPRKPTVN